MLHLLCWESFPPVQLIPQWGQKLLVWHYKSTPAQEQIRFIQDELQEENGQ